MKRTVLVLAGMVLVGAHPVAQAADKIKVMLLDGQNNHRWQETTPVMKRILEEAGVFTVQVVTSPPRGGFDSLFRVTTPIHYAARRHVFVSGSCGVSFEWVSSKPESERARLMGEPVTGRVRQIFTGPFSCCLWPSSACPWCLCPLCP